LSEELIGEMIAHIAALERRLDDLDLPAQAYHYQPITIVKGWDPASNKASQTLNLQAAPWSLPAGIKAVAVYLAYTAANNGDNGQLEKSSGNGTAVFAICPDAAEYGSGSGIVNCDANGDIYFTTNQATNTVYLFIHGYFI